MELRQLRYFIAVAKHESFKQAASELHIAQPALSRQISLLEHELRTPLLIRHARGSIPTEDGQLVFKEAERILHLTEELKQQLLFRRAEIRGAVRIGLGPTIAEWAAPEMTETLARKHPEVQLSFFEGLSPRLRRMLMAGQVDMAVLSLTSDATHLLLGTKFTETISLIGQAGDPLLAGDRPLAIEELVNLPIILAGIRKEGIRNLIEAALDAAHLEFSRIVAEVESVFLARPMVERGLGYTISIDSAVMAGLGNGTLASRPIEGLMLERILARSAERSPSHAVLEASDVLADILSRRLPRYT